MRNGGFAMASRSAQRTFPTTRRDCWPARLDWITLAPRRKLCENALFVFLAGPSTERECFGRDDLYPKGGCASGVLPSNMQASPSNMQASLRTSKPPFERQASLRAPETIGVHQSLPVTNEPTVGSGNVTNEPNGAWGKRDERTQRCPGKTRRTNPQVPGKT